MAAHRVTRLLLVACRERSPEGAVPLCLRHGSEKHVEWFPGLPEAFATIRPSSRSLSKKTKESYTFGTSCAIPATELRWLLRETIVGSERQCSSRAVRNHRPKREAKRGSRLFLPLQGSVSRPETVFEEVWADFSTFRSCRSLLGGLTGVILPTFKSCTRQPARRDSSYAPAAWSKFAPPIARFRYPCWALD